MNNKNIAWIILEEAQDLELSKPRNIKKDENGHPVAEAIFQEANEWNRNKRFYNDKDLFPAVLPEFCPRTKELLESGTLRCESGHPDSKDLTRQQKIDKKNCSAIILKLWRENNYVCAKYRGTNNELGRELEQDLLEGYFQAFSFRGLGSVENTPKGAAVKDIKFITYDEVIYPSHPRAYTRKSLSESAGNISERSTVKNILEEDTTYVKNDKGILVPITNSDVISFIKSESSNLKAIRESFDIYYDDITLLENGRDIRLSDKQGNLFIVKCESFIRNEIMNYCNKY